MDHGPVHSLYVRLTIIIAIHCNTVKYELGLENSIENNSLFLFVCLFVYLSSEKSEMCGRASRGPGSFLK